MDRILHLAGFDHGVNRQQVDLQVLAAHGVHALDIVFGIVKESSAAPRRLNFQGHGLGMRYIRKRQGRCRRRGPDGAGLKELAPACRRLGLRQGLPALVLLNFHHLFLLL